MWVYKRAASVGRRSIGSDVGGGVRVFESVEAIIVVGSWQFSLVLVFADDGPSPRKMPVQSC